MAITAKFREDGSGGAENPWATDLDGNAITIDDDGRTAGTIVAQIDSGRISLHTTDATGGCSAWASGATSYADGLLRAVLRANNDLLLYQKLQARKTTSNGTNVALVLKYDVAVQDYLQVRYGAGVGTLVTQVTASWVLDTDYEAVFYFKGTAYKALTYAGGTFPPGSDYKTVTWDIEVTNASPPTATGKPGVAHDRGQSADVTGYADDVLGWAAGENPTSPTFSLSASSGQIQVTLSDATAIQKRAVLWYFLRYKAGSQPTDENDGTLVTGAGTGLGGSAIRSDGRFVDAPAAFNITSLSNGTTYYVRVFAVTADPLGGTGNTDWILEGNSASDTPTGGDVTPPDVPDDFAAAYADPFVASRIDLAWTNPSEAGDYKITYRTDGVDPTSSTDGTVLVNWTAYTANSDGTASATSLTDGLRYRFALWHRDAASNISSGAFVQKVAVHQITQDTPADAATGVQTAPYLIWDTTAGEAEDGVAVQYRVEVSTSEADEASFVAGRLVDASSMTSAFGFEQETSTDVWAPLPQTGLADADVGSRVRYRADLLTDPGHYYWRVTAQQAGS